MIPADQIWVWTFLITSSWAADWSLFVWATLHYLLTCQGRAAYSVKSFMKTDIQLEKKTGDRKSAEPEVFTSLYHFHFTFSLSLCLCSSASGVIQELLINNSLITRSKWTIHVQLWMHDSVLMLFMNCHMINWTGQATVIPANAGKSSPSPHKAKVWVATRCNSWVEGRCVWLQPRTSSLLMWTLFSSWICNVGPFSHLVSVNVSWSSQRPVSLCCSINIKHWSKVNF